jgi:hypothetical protein
MKCRRPHSFTVVAVVTVSLLVAACGSTSPSASGSGGQPTQARAQQDAVSFVQCLRSHGVTNVPDPTPTSGYGFKSAISGDEQSPAFQSASAACQHLMPGGGPSDQSPAPSQAQTAAYLAFARCIRSRGFPSFPDPNTGGELTHEMLASAGINLQQPAVLRAGDVCVSVTHGFITKAVVARFAAGH